MKVDEQVEETIHSMIHKDTQKLCYRISMKDSHNLSILDAFPIFNLDNTPTNTTSSEFSVYDHSEINVLSLSLKNGKVLNMIYCQ